MEKRKLTDYIPLALKGMAMGAADVVPGVSGGTMAFILNIYEELIHSIHTFASIDTLKLIFGFKFKEAFETLPWRFLVAVGIGVLVSIVTLASGIKWALANHPSLLWAFFFGLVAASILTVFNKVQSWSISRYISMAIGAVVAWLIVGLMPAETSTNPFFVTLCGALAICAMILPGISGSFILLLLGKYQYVLGAVTGLKTALIEGKFDSFVDDLLILIYTGIGAVVGLSTFVKLLDWLFKKFHDITVALLIGFMIGSLRKIWPWKNTIETYINSHGIEKPLVEENILPQAFDSNVITAMGLAIVGFVFIIIMVKIADKAEAPEQA